MANFEHLKILRDGASAWNSWRLTNVDLKPDLEGVDLTALNLSLRDYDFSYANLKRARLSQKALSCARFIGAQLTEADLSYCHMLECDFQQAIMQRANLASSTLTGAKFNEADLTGAQFNDAYLLGTAFLNTNLQNAQGLSDCHYGGDISLDESTILKSWPLPTILLRQSGLSSKYIKYIIEKIDRRPDIFLCHSSNDKSFVRQLASDLATLHVKAWFDEWELAPGDSLHESIGDALEESTHVGVVLSESAITSNWCRKELYQALSRESRVGRCLILPLICQKIPIPVFLEDKVYLDFSTDYYSKLTKLVALLRGGSFRSIARSVVETPPTNIEDVGNIIERAFEDTAVTEHPRATVVMASDMPLDFLGRRKGSVLLKIDRAPVTKEDIARAFHEALSFPVLNSDEDRKKYLMLCAISHERDEIGGVRNPLQLLGTGIGRIFSQQLLDIYCQHAGVAESIATIILKTLCDHSRHSKFIAFDEGNSIVWVAANTWYGYFKDVASENQGEVIRVAQDAANQTPGKVSAVLCLDYYIVDADASNDRPFYLALAVSFFPLLPDELPSRLRTVVVHRGLLKDEEWSKFQTYGGNPNLTPSFISEEEGQFKSLLRSRFEKSMVYRNKHQWEQLIELWKPLYENPLFRVDHPKWRDEPYFRCQIHSANCQMFTAFIGLHAKDREAYGFKAFSMLRELLKENLYSLERAASDQLGKEVARVQDLNYIDTLDLALSFLGGWGGTAASLCGVSQEEAEEIEIMVQQRLKELHSIMDMYDEEERC